jgi:hypothetical protein
MAPWSWTRRAAAFPAALMHISGRNKRAGTKRAWSAMIMSRVTPNGATKANQSTTHVARAAAGGLRTSQEGTIACMWTCEVAARRRVANLIPNEKLGGLERESPAPVQPETFAVIFRAPLCSPVHVVSDLMHGCAYDPRDMFAAFETAFDGSLDGVEDKGTAHALPLTRSVVMPMVMVRAACMSSRNRSAAVLSNRRRTGG